MPDVPQLCHLPFIRPEDFPEFAEILDQDEDFPATYEAWETFLSAKEEEIWEGGNVPLFTSARPIAFRRFVVSSTGSANFNALTAYVASLCSTAEEDA